MDAKLRKLADYFLAAGSAAAVHPKDIAPALLPYVYILDIERARMTGTEFDHVFRRALDGRYMEDFLHGPRGADVVAGFHDCAATHTPLWMRQVVRLPDKTPRFVEGVAIYLAPERIYGGLLVGDVTHQDPLVSFERETLALPV
jgi:hypothetical protein